jgi:porphobilinogen synthase
MTFGVSHHLDASGSDTWRDDGLVSRMSRSPRTPCRK